MMSETTVLVLLPEGWRSELGFCWCFCNLLPGEGVCGEAKPIFCEKLLDFERVFVVALEDVD